MRNVVYKARHWRKRAADLHTLASNKRYADVNDTILRIAKSYEKMAAAAEDARRSQARLVHRAANRCDTHRMARQPSLADVSQA